MRVLIVENEIYLAQSIASKLSSLGYECEIASKTKYALELNKFNIVLLSTNLNEDGIYEVIEKFSNSIIILLVSYISNDTLTNPIKAGADDFIQKPFMIEELIRKIKHYEEFNNYKQKNLVYKRYIEKYLLPSSSQANELKKLTLPLYIKSEQIKDASCYVLLISMSFNFVFEVVDLSLNFSFDKFLQKLESSFNIFYMPNLQALKKQDQQRLLEIVKHKPVIISSTDMQSTCSFKTICIEACEKKSLITDRILTIDEYIKHIISNYQDTFSDTEISKRLGISRKSLWEKRRRYGMSKKRQNDE